MKKITDSALFRQVVANESVVKSIKNIHVSRDRVDITKLDESLNIISRRITFPTKGKTMQYVNKGDIILINNPTIKLPKYLSTFGKVEGGKIVALVDIGYYSTVNKTTGMYDIYPKTLFNLMQNGTILLELVNNWNRFTNNMTILKNGAIVYSKLVGKVMDKLFAINIDDYKLDLINFFLAKFFLINLCGKTNNDTVDNIAYHACFNKSSLKLIKEEEMRFDNNAYEDIFKLFDNLRDIKGMKDLNVRSFVENWARMYGETTLLGLDYLPSFLSTIFGAVVNGNISKDYIIESVAGKFINSIYTEFSKLLK
ncbi:virion protein [Bacillus phage AR9]|uniref:Virion protein n=2 Tax=Bacillus phage PBS1 TaxID=10683 RepID=A0A172JIH7_BPPB1|nr:virion structural protein [Bacillus phage AR9]YP_009664375.1 virion structural protein [Bacillus phage PBS1]QXN70204.1 hypothetical protein INTERNEXUS_164 [Bacillus phage vB_BspM_Internexus]WCS68409.1 hypothetical protein Goe21_03000 [Bacillus phage vB_BsuM-Goe21]AMS01365.1 virion protein [Bacillus phage AR9]AST99995.1 hypothetical protein PBI_PBS1_174 [Bacillus phage PBS1]BDE75490.1 hypothetical protein [Bacillus phage PBS1]